MTEMKRERSHGMGQCITRIAAGGVGLVAAPMISPRAALEPLPPWLREWALCIPCR